MTDPELLQALQGVTDPELGISIVDLGLVYRAERTARGIEAALTMTTAACPLGELIVEQARTALERSFPDARPITVDLVWEPMWTPDRVTPEGRHRLGWR